MGYDGMVTIGFKGDTKQLEKDIRDSERQLKQYEREAERLTKQQQKVDLNLQDYYKLKKAIEDSTKKNLEFASTEKAKARILNEQNIQMQQLNEAYSKQFTELENINEKIKENTKGQEIAKAKIKSLNGELAKTKGYDKIKGSIDDIGKGIQKITKRVVKWGLAIFGIRSAYLFIRQSMSTLSQYDEQLATDLEYIRWTLATTLKPLIEWIIKAVYTLIGVVGSLLKSIFNVNIFANASAEAFRNAKDSLAGSNKQAKQLQKTLAGFDEMNVLQDNTSTGGAGANVPTMDFGNIMDNQDVQKIADFWKDIIRFWTEDFDDFFNSLDGNWGTFFKGILRFSKGFIDTIVGYFDIVKGAIQIVFGLITGDFDLVGKGFDTLIQGIKNVFIGFAEMVLGRIMVIFGFVKGVVLDIWNFIYSYLIKPILDFFGGLFNTVRNVVNDIFNKVSEVFGGLIDIVKKPFTSMVDFVKDLWKKIKEPIDKLVKNINKALDKVNPLNILGDIGKGIGKGIGSIGKLFGFAKGGIVVPKLATGGIINNPGRGVPIASAIGGERGAEGVIPLTDSQQMETLGEAIGRYITVNLTNITELDGRQIARKVDKIQQNNNFVFNR